MLEPNIVKIQQQRPLSCGGHLAVGHDPRTLPPTPTPLLQTQRAWEKKLEVSCGKRKT